MRARGQGLLTIGLVGVVALLALSFDRLGPKAPAAASPGLASSGVWLCPHGGGPEWEAALYLANPGETDVRARVTALGARRPRLIDTIEVPAGGQVRVEAPAGERGSASYVEYFGGWISAGWVARGASGEAGIGTEPCSPTAGRTWFSSGVSTGQDEQAYLIVMNPFASDAVLDIALFFAPPRNPGRDSELTDVTLDPGRSTAIRLNPYGEGEAAVGVGVNVSTGRIAAATTLVSSQGIASVLAAPQTTLSAHLPTIQGAGRSVVSLSVPTDQGSDVGAFVLSARATRPVPNLAAAAIDPTSAATFPVAVDGPASVDVAVQEGEPVMAALRTQGLGRDDAATAGATEPSAAWVVPPTVVGEPARPGIVIVNPGDTEATVTVRLLPLDATSATETTLVVPAASVATVPEGFLQAQPDASVVVTSEGAEVIAMGASTSLGVEGGSVFGLSVGVPIPVTNG